MSDDSTVEAAPADLPIQEEFVMDELYNPAKNSQEMYEEFEENAPPAGSKDFPFSEEAMRNAQAGQYENTMFKMWEMYLQGAIRQCDEPLSIPLADGILRQWPWFKYYDLPVYLSYRKQMLVDALNTLQECYPKPAEDLFTENVDDWNLHKEAYLEVIVAWTRLTNAWNAKWFDTPLNKPAKAILHGVVSDVAALLINPQSGLIENLRNLANFYVSEEEGQELAWRGAQESDDD